MVLDVASGEFPVDVPESDWTNAHLDRLRFIGSGGACGALDEDPRGQYWVAGFVQQADGSLEMHIFGRFAIGSGPDDPAVLEAIHRVEASPQLTPPAAGSAGLLTPDEPRSAGREALVAAFGALVLGGAPWSRRWGVR